MTAITRIAFALQDAPAAVETHSITPARTRGVHLRITVAIDVTLRNVSTRDAQVFGISRIAGVHSDKRYIF